MYLPYKSRGKRVFFKVMCAANTDKKYYSLPFVLLSLGIIRIVTVVKKMTFPYIPIKCANLLKLNISVPNIKGQSRRWRGRSFFSFLWLTKKIFNLCGKGQVYHSGEKLILFIIFFLNMNTLFSLWLWCIFGLLFRDLFGRTICKTRLDFTL